MVAWLYSALYRPLTRVALVLGTIIMEALDDAKMWCGTGTYR